jgi:hypothetical protein
VNAQLRTQFGRLSGKVTGPSGAYVGATVIASNGAKTYTTTSSSPGGTLVDGGYLFTSIEPGIYSVTVRADGMRQQTARVSITGGTASQQNLTLVAGP